MRARVSTRQIQSGQMDEAIRINREQRCLSSGSGGDSKGVTQEPRNRLAGQVAPTDDSVCAPAAVTAAQSAARVAKQASTRTLVSPRR